MILDIVIPFLTIGVAELGDKTQIAVFNLATRTDEHLKLLLAVVLAFALADGLAIILGNIIINIIPLFWIRMVAGSIFIIFGVVTLLKKDEAEDEVKTKKTFVSSFLLVFVSEMGDKTQITSGLFATKYNPILVFIGVMLALTLLSLMAIYLGKLVSTKINKKVIKVVAGVLFIGIGLLTLFGIL